MKVPRRRGRRRPPGPGAPSRALSGAVAALRAGIDPAGRSGRAAFALLALPAAALWALRLHGPALPGWGRGPEALVVVALALLLVPAAGHVLRRLSDMGRGSAWAWLLLLPWLRLGLLAVLLLAPSSQRPRPARGGPLALGLAGGAALLLLASLGWTATRVEAGDMRPTLWPGDLLLLRRAPLAPAVGDVLAFRLPGEEAVRVGRVLGLPGDHVAVAAGVPSRDGAPAAQAEDGFHAEPFRPAGPAGALPLCGNGAVGLGAACTTRQRRESLPGEAGWHRILDLGDRPLDDWAGGRVPTGAVAVLGDARGEARDSRLAPAAGGAGFVPLAAVRGRVALVLASSAAAHPLDPRGWRLRLLVPLR